MTRSILSRRLFLSCALALFVLSAQAQNLSLQSDSRLWIEGTSTKSDWTVQASEVKAEMAIDGESIESVKVTVPSAKIISNKSTIMDRLMHGALKVTEHPVITYELDEDVAGIGSAMFSVETSGKLTLAGVTKSVAFTVQGQRLDGGKIRLKGTMPLKMSDYGITPPNAMFGALRTADDVTVHFEVVVAPASS
jgi:polyisoprenoid-binding protein YceI